VKRFYSLAILTGGVLWQDLRKQTNSDGGRLKARKGGAEFFGFGFLNFAQIPKNKTEEKHAEESLKITTKSKQNGRTKRTPAPLASVLKRHKKSP
jgi:hypothetical protein